jgi:inward rectifier potassium channel
MAVHESANTALLVRNEVTAEGERVRRFYDLSLARSSNAVFALSWTAMHPITRDSLLHGATGESLRAQSAQLIVSLMGIDETSSQTVHARHAYAVDDIRWETRFADILSREPNGQQVVDYRKFHDVVPVATREQ